MIENINFTYLAVVLLCSLPFILIRPVRKFVKYYSTLFHEFGHAIASLVLGGGVKSIRLEYDGSGLTTSSHPVNTTSLLTRFASFVPARVIVLLSGYSFPINLAIVLLTLLATGVPVEYIFGVYTVVGGLTLLLIRNSFGFIIVICYLVITVITWTFVPETISVYVAGSLASLLLILGIFDIVNVTKINFIKRYRQDNAHENDFTFLKQATLISSRLWNILYIVGQIIVVPALMVATSSTVHSLL